MAAARIAPHCANTTLQQPGTCFSFDDNGLNNQVGAPSISLRIDNATRIPVPVQVSQLGRRRKSNEGEIDVFGAEKYFSGGMDGGADGLYVRKLQPSPEKGRNNIATSPGTPSICSDASRNSRSSLLRVAERANAPQQRGGTGRGRRVIDIFRCKCSGESSVEVSKGNSSNGETRATHAQQELRRGEDVGRCREVVSVVGVGFDKEDYLGTTFTSFNRVVAGNSTVNGVFGSPIHERQLLSSNLQKDLALLSVGIRGAVGDEDDGSETSSELFEIESISTNNNPYSFLPKGTNSTMSQTTTTYEPSEASVEWSVVTASAANFPLEADGSEWSMELTRMPPEANKQRRNSGLFMGCASEKAVGISSNTYKIPERVASDKSQPTEKRSPVTPMARQMTSLKTARAGSTSWAAAHRAAATHTPQHRYGY